MLIPIERPAVLQGRTYKIQLDHISSALYITINDIKINNTLRPLELFINTMEANLQESMSTITRLVSAILRQGENIEFVFKELEDMFASQPFFYRGKKYHSIAAIVGELLTEHCKEIGYSDR